MIVEIIATTMNEFFQINIKILEWDMTKCLNKSIDQLNNWD